VRFKIISVGWNCESVAEQTLRSIDAQTLHNYDVLVVDDASTDGTYALVDAWAREHGQNWKVLRTPTRQFVVRNQYGAVHSPLLDVGDDDVVIFLDLDGDRFAHDQVLECLTEAYGRGNLVTYGSFRNATETARCPITMRFPPEVEAANSYRAELGKGQQVFFNHLRTMAGVIAKAIPESYFKFDDGTWYTSATDYAFMAAALELAGGRYESIDEVLCIYNNVQPHPDNKTQPAATVNAAMHTFRRRPLAPLEVTR
jgi:glycosyltransferase involved in cell wall biosynthesis